MLDHAVARQAIANTIQSTYNDATQTVLDLQCADKIVQALVNLGWVSPSEVALVMLGERVETWDAAHKDRRVDIHIPRDLIIELMPGDWEITRLSNWDTLAVTMRIRRTVPS